MTDVRINIRSRRDIRMTEPFFDIVDVPTLVNEYTGCRMPKIMISHLRQSMALQGTLKTPCKAIGAVGHTVGILKDVIVVMVA